MARKKKKAQFKARPNKERQQIHKNNLSLIKKLLDSHHSIKAE